MKILVFSDSHGINQYMVDIIKKCREDLSMIIHLGDVCEDARYINRLFPDIVLCAVRGNNDFFNTHFVTDIEMKIGGVDTFITHGHKYGVKYSISALQSKAESIDAKLVLFGHTHRPMCENNNGVYYVNPGSVSYMDGSPTFGIIHIENGVIASASVETWDDIKGEIK